jgi:guanylate kinase
MANLFIIAAPSGCGKTSLVKALIEKVDNLCVSVSHTTRAARPGEEHGKNYFFVSKEAFNEISNNNGFIESAQVFDNYYGSAKQTVKDLLEQGQDVILEIDWQGAQAVRALVNPISIFILPPSLDALKERLTGRATDSEAVIAKRLASSVADIRHYKQFNYVVINDNFDEAVEELIAIVKATRLNLHNLKRTQADLLHALEA